MRSRQGPSVLVAVIRGIDNEYDKYDEKGEALRGLGSVGLTS